MKRLLMFLGLLVLVAETSHADESYRRSVGYYLMIDRFANGSSENDFAKKGDPDAARHWPNKAEYGFPQDHIGNLSYDYRSKGEPDNFSDWKKFWGGDLQGATDKLDYVKELGVDLVYFSSPVKQSETTAYYINEKSEKHGFTAYHGFWPKDLFRIDEHFAGPTRWEDTAAGEQGGREGWEIFKKLKDKSESLNMNLMIDAVINHSNFIGLGEAFNFAGKSYPAGTAGWGENGAVYKDKVFQAAAGDYFVDGKRVAQKDELWFYNQFGSGNDAVNETAFNGFGQRGLGDYNFTMKGSVDQSARWQAWSYAEFDNPKPYQLVLDAYKKFIDHGVNAMRLDATKHVELPYLRRLSKDLREYAQQTYGRQLYLVGEWFGAGFPAGEFGGGNKYRHYDELYSYAHFNDYFETNPTANLDFVLAFIIQDVFAKGDGFYKLSEYLEKKTQYFDQHSSEISKYDQMITYNNHDMPRFMQVAKHYGRKYPVDQAKKLQMLASLFLLSSEGIPLFYYGDEIFLHKDNPSRLNDSDPYNRPMMPEGFDSLYKNDPLVSKHKALLQTMAKVRRDSDAAVYGKLYTRFVSSDVYCFERLLEDESLLVCLNKADEAVLLDEIPLSFPDGEYEDLLDQTQVAWVKDAKLSKFKLDAFSALVIRYKN